MGSNIRAKLESAQNHRYRAAATAVCSEADQQVKADEDGERIANFDQDGTLWVGHPIYSQVVYCLERVPAVVKAKPELTKEPALLLNDNDAGKPEGIHLMIGRRPYAAFGNSTGDQQMLEYSKAGDGARLAMVVLHDDAKREYADGPAQGLPDTKVGTFTQALYDEAKKQGWIVFSMKNDWKRIFALASLATGPVSRLECVSENPSKRNARSPAGRRAWVGRGSCAG
jgi:hypothetical protein